MGKLVTALVACAIACAACSRCRAQAEDDDALWVATIVRIEGDDVFLDVGRDALAGTAGLTVYRRVVVRHPITRKSLVDRFAIGELVIAQASDTLTLARAKGPPERPFHVGDRISSTASEKRASAPQADASPPAATPSAAREGSSAPAPDAASTVTGVLYASAPATPDEEAAELLRAYRATFAQAPSERIRIYEDYLRRLSRSRHRAFVEQELRYLHTWDNATLTCTREIDEAQRLALLASALELLPPSQAPAGRALKLAARVRPDAKVRSLLLHVRPSGSKLYQTLEVEIDPQEHARVTLPAELARAPGFEFFIEANNEEGETAAVFANGHAPYAVAVQQTRQAPERRREPVMRVRFSSELASFDATSGRDYFLINEGDFLYRICSGALYGIRMGYGRFDGQGGTVNELDKLGLGPRPAGFTYAFFESELALGARVGVALRATLGLGRPEPGERGEISGGFQTRLRLGDRDGTNLVIAGELMPEIGQRAYLHLGWQLIERVPMAAEVVVTDQPVNSDELAVRIVYELGYAFTEHVAIALRPSYQLRTIRHAGPGVGLSATFDW